MLILLVEIGIWILSIAMPVCAVILYATHQNVMERTVIRDRKSGNSIGTGKTATKRQNNIVLNMPFIIAVLGILVFMLCSIKKELERGFLPPDNSFNGFSTHTGPEWAGDDN